MGIEKSDGNTTEIVEEKFDPYPSEKKCSYVMISIVAMIIVLICNAVGIAIILKFYFWEKYDNQNEIVMINDIFS